MTASSTARRPRAAITANGTTHAGCVESFEVENNNFFASDTFDVTVALGALPPGFGAAFFCDNQVEIGVQAALDDGPFTTLVQGFVDTFDLDLPSGTLSLRGRDRSADFIDTKTDLKYQNLTASQVAQKLAAEHGLAANVQATTTLTGRYYEIDHARLTNNVSEWTLLTYLAQEEGFDCFVTGTTLNFLPSQQGGQPGFTIAYQPGQQVFGNIHLKRSQTLAKDVVVKVVSWNAKQAAAFTKTASRGASLKGAQNGTAQVYTFKVPGLTPDQAQQFANARLADISQHERVVTITMPGELTLQPRQLVALTGTGTSFDQSYYIDSIRREMSMGGGFSQTISMKNHTPESTVSV